MDEPEQKEEEAEKEESGEESVEEEKTKKKPMKKAKSTKSLSKKSSPKKSPTKARKLSNSTFLKYLELLNQSIAKENDYEEKIAAQKDLVKCIKEFTSEASEKLTNYLK